MHYKSSSTCVRFLSLIYFLSCVMYKNLGYSCTNYIDDFGRAETSTKSAAAFLTLGDLLRCLGLSTSPEKDSLPATSMVFLGVLVDMTAMTISVTTDRLRNLIHAVNLSSLRRTFHGATCCPRLCPLSPPVYVLPAFLCRHSFTPSDHLGCSNTARFQVLITLNYAGGVTSYHTTMVLRSLRLRLGLTIACSSPRTHAAPVRGGGGGEGAMSTGGTFTLLSPTPFSASFDTT